MAGKSTVKVCLEIILKKGEGPRQDEDTVIERLLKEIEGIGSVYAQDEDHAFETEYEITSISQVVN